MEIKAQLNKPYTDKQRMDFIVEQNHRKGYEVKETEEALEAWGYTEEEKSLQRKKDFESKFLSTSKGNYRLQPKGYSNAQQSVDTINGMVNALGGLTQQIAQMVIFYPTPDFTKEEECTEEWLIAHQYNAEPMTKEEWTDFYIEFSSLYAMNQYKKANENVN
jgi:hypothetical protein